MFEEASSSKIKLIIKGNGNQAFLNETFYKEPSKIIVNNIIRRDCKKFCNLESYTSNIILEFNDNITSCENMFNGLRNLKEIDLSKFDFSYVTSIKSMYKDCINLIKINFGNIKTSSINNMDSLFKNCYKLTLIDLSKFDTSMVTTFEAMFSNCRTIKSIDVSSFNTKKAVNMIEMFAYCTQLISLNLSSFDTSNVINMKIMFYSCKNIKYIDLQHFSDTSLDNISDCFEGCSKLLYLNLKSFRITNNHKLNFTQIFSNHPLNIMYCFEDSYTKNIIVGNKLNNCSDFCFQENVIFDIKKGICTCIENLKFEYNNSCYYECPHNTYKKFKDKYICNIIELKNYYHNNNDNKYKARFLKSYIQSRKNDDNKLHRTLQNNGQGGPGGAQGSNFPQNEPKCEEGINHPGCPGFNENKCPHPPFSFKNCEIQDVNGPGNNGENINEYL